ncbi:MAG: fimbria/pilus outer membrane usher protein [Anaeromyxobacteraceae bacterium]
MLRLLVNTEDEGVRLVVLAADGDVLVAASDLGEAGFREVARLPADDAGRVSLRALAPGVGFAVDEASATLELTAEPRLLRRTLVDLARPDAAGVEVLEARSALLNYGAHLSRSGPRGEEHLDLTADAAVRPIDGWLFASTLTQRLPERRAPVRLLSAATRDFPDARGRLTVGDALVGSGLPGFSGVALGGIAFQTTPAVAPLLTTTPALDLAGVLQTPSEVEVWVDGQLVQRRRMPAGEFELRNLVAGQGGRAVELVVRDAYGRETRLDSRHYLSSRLLLPGLTDLTLAAGFGREGFGAESFRYGAPVAVAAGRHGLSRALTVGASVEADPTAVAAGGSATAIVGPLGELELSLGASRSGAGTGYAAELRHARATRAAGIHAAVSAVTGGWARPGLQPSAAGDRLEASLGAGVGAAWVGTIGASIAFTSARSGPDVLAAAGSWQRPLGRGLQLAATIRRTWTSAGRTEVFVTLTGALAERWWGGFDQRWRDDRGRAAFQLQRAPPPGAGVGVRVSGERTELPGGEAELSGAAEVRALGSRGEVTARASRGPEGRSYDLGVAGGLAWVGGSFLATRSIQDAFALVEVPGAEGVPVRRNGTAVGTASGEGVIVTDLLSHHPNRLSVDPDAFPPGVEVTTTRRISPPHRGGVVVRFEPRRRQGLRGRALFVGAEGRVPAELARLTIETEGASIEAVVGRDGRLFAEDVPPGPRRARLSSGARACWVTFEVPRTDALVVDAGELACAPEAAVDGPPFVR